MTFVAGQERAVVEQVEEKGAPDTKLTAYFEISKARQKHQEEPLKYVDVPNLYVWDTKNRTWNKRQRRAKGGEVIGRLFQCSPKKP